LSFRLSGEVTEPQLFRSIMDGGINRGGKVFYREDDSGNIVEVVYFSGAKSVRYKGKIDQELANRIRVDGSKVKTLEFDDDQGILKIIQG